MQVSAKLKFARLSPQKCRLVCDQIRGKKIDAALEILKFSPKKPAFAIKKLLSSAIANAEHNFGADIDFLEVTQIFADQGPTLKRMHARAKGRSNRILKPTTHITIVVGYDDLGA